LASKVDFKVGLMVYDAKFLRYVRFHAWFASMFVTVSVSMSVSNCSCPCPRSVSFLCYFLFIFMLRHFRLFLPLHATTNRPFGDMVCYIVLSRRDKAVLNVAGVYVLVRKRYLFSPLFTNDIFPPKATCHSTSIVPFLS
jgi:hypothetical protein